ncbi:MAG: exodeoxyribonuclease VII small subunit [Candidatus Binatota bacterium]|nr:exodeoxyribonuclease VII small subunit [Candidatus Binatota bacterium]
MAKAKKPAAKAATANYQLLKSELDTVMAELQREDLDVDAALKHYQRGLELVRSLEQYLKTAENQVIELKNKFNPPAK